MGWKNTETVSRSKAIDVILLGLYTITNEELANVLEVVNDATKQLGTGHNFIVEDSYGCPGFDEEEEKEDDKD